MSSKRRSSSQPGGSPTKHPKADMINFVDIKDINDTTPQGSFTKLNIDTLCRIYPNNLKNMIEKSTIQSVSILVRPLIGQMISLLTTGIGDEQRIIKGPPGCGKSTVLYQVVQYCKLTGWIVFYLPDCAVLKFKRTSMEANTACSLILIDVLEMNKSIFQTAQMPYNEPETFAEHIEKGLRAKKCEDCLFQLISSLLALQNGPKVLFAFDSWNKLLHENPSPNPIAELIAFWSYFRVKNGVAFFSTTSSLEKDSKINLNVFPNATGESDANFLYVPPFNKDETEFIWRLERQRAC